MLQTSLMALAQDEMESIEVPSQSTSRPADSSQPVDDKNEALQPPLNQTNSALPSTPSDPTSGAASSSTAEPEVPGNGSATKKVPNWQEIFPGSTKNPSCPFSPWKGAHRFCFDCQWCPYSRQSCCEADDERNIMRGIRVSGNIHWDCFITISRFQECGKCSPSSAQYAQSKSLSYVNDNNGFNVRICQKACANIYRRCKGTKLLDGTEMIPKGVTLESFCQDAPMESSPEVPCYSSTRHVYPISLLMTVMMILVCHL